MVASRVETWTLDCSHTTPMKVVSEGMPAAWASTFALWAVDEPMTEVVVREMNAGMLD